MKKSLYILNTVLYFLTNRKIYKQEFLVFQILTEMTPTAIVC